MTGDEAPRHVRDEHTGLELTVPASFTLVDTPIAAVVAVAAEGPDGRVRPAIIATVSEADRAHRDTLAWAIAHTTTLQRTTPATIVMDVAVRSDTPHRPVEVVTSTTDGALTFIAITEFRLLGPLRVTVDVVGSPWDLSGLWHLSRAISESVVAPQRPSPPLDDADQLGLLRALLSDAATGGRP